MMGLLDGQKTYSGKYGTVSPRPGNTRRRRFMAWFECGIDIRVKHFSTRRAAHDWLNLLEAR